MSENAEKAAAATFPRKRRSAFKGFVDKHGLAEEFGVTPRTIERWVNRRVIPQPRKVGRFRLWHLDSLRQQLAKEAA